MSESASSPTVDLMFGPMLIGVFLNTILFGVLLNQMYSYFQTYRGDAVWMRIFVAYLLLMETVNTVLDIGMMFQPLITDFGKQKAVENFPTLFLTEPIVLVLISTPIQCFFAWRIVRIAETCWIPAAIVLLSLVSFAGGLITGVKIASLKLFIHKPELHWSALLWFVTSCISDLLIAGTLVYSLSRRKTGNHTTDSVIDKVIRMTVQTGVLTAICAICDIIFFMSLPHTALNFVWDFILSKLYANCLLSTLNARSTLFDHNQTPPEGSDGFDFRRYCSKGKQNKSRSTRSGAATDNGVIYDLESGKSAHSHISHLEIQSGVTFTRVVESRVGSPVTGTAL